MDGIGSQPFLGSSWTVVDSFWPIVAGPGSGRGPLLPGMQGWKFPTYRGRLVAVDPVVYLLEGGRQGEKLSNVSSPGRWLNRWRSVVGSTSPCSATRVACHCRLDLGTRATRHALGSCFGQMFGPEQITSATASARILGGLPSRSRLHAQTTFVDAATITLYTKYKGVRR